MQHNLRLIQFLLDLHDTVRLLRILIFDYIFLEFGERQRGGCGGEGGAGIAGEELVDHFREELVRDKGWVVGVADDDAGNTFGAAVGVEDVCLTNA